MWTRMGSSSKYEAGHLIDQLHIQSQTKMPVIELLPPFQRIKRTRSLRRTLTIKIEKQNLDYIICN
jgi:hypothetical protein